MTLVQIYINQSTRSYKSSPMRFQKHMVYKQQTWVSLHICITPCCIVLRDLPSSYIYLSCIYHN